MPDARFFTVGHSNREADEFLALLNDNEIQELVDVRKLPGSNRYPQFNADQLADRLSQNHIGFNRYPGLTGRRPVDHNIAFDTNAWWQNRSFHNYADHALSNEFRQALQALLQTGTDRITAVMCSEAVWWRCHRRIITDYLLAHEQSVTHIMGPGQSMSATLSAGAVPQPDGTVLYPPDDG